MLNDNIGVNNYMKEELLKGLSEEQIAKIRECKNTEEVLAIAKEEGIELTDEQLEAVSGGCSKATIHCPNCGSTNLTKRPIGFAHRVSGYRLTCNDCGTKWETGL